MGAYLIADLKPLPLVPQFKGIVITHDLLFGCFVVFQGLGPFFPQVQRVPASRLPFLHIHLVRPALQYLLPHSAFAIVGAVPDDHLMPVGRLEITLCGIAVAEGLAFFLGG